MPSRLRFVTQDVFTAEVFGGNRLAVLPDARDADGRSLPTAVMQAIAAEFGFSETAFVLPSRCADCVRRVRIFTPARELPFAGHPTVGTALALVQDGLVPMAGDEVAFALDLDAGPTPVVVRRRDGRLEAEFTAPRPPVTGPTTDPAAAATALRLAPAAIDTSAHLPVDAGAGLEFVVIRLVDLQALAQAAPDRLSLRTLPTPAARHGVLCYVPIDARSGHLRVRVFVPEMGIDEDPATGSAAAALAGLLAGLGPGPDGTRTYVLEQGVEMGRPSQLRTTAEVLGGVVAAVRVAGGAVTVMDGWLHLPE